MCTSANARPHDHMWQSPLPTIKNPYILKSLRRAQELMLSLFAYWLQYTLFRNNQPQSPLVSTVYLFMKDSPPPFLGARQEGSAVSTVRLHVHSPCEKSTLWYPYPPPFIFSFFLFYSHLVRWADDYNFIIIICILILFYAAPLQTVWQYVVPHLKNCHFSTLQLITQLTYLPLHFHSRMIPDIFCANCSKYKKSLPEMGYSMSSKQRVCFCCYGKPVSNTIKDVNA